MQAKSKASSVNYHKSPSLRHEWNNAKKVNKQTHIEMSNEVHRGTYPKSKVTPRKQECIPKRAHDTMPNEVTSNEAITIEHELLLHENELSPSNRRNQSQNASVIIICPQTVPQPHHQMNPYSHSYQPGLYQHYSHQYYQQQYQQQNQVVPYNPSSFQYIGNALPPSYDYDIPTVQPQFIPEQKEQDSNDYCYYPFPKYSIVCRYSPYTTVTSAFARFDDGLQIPFFPYREGMLGWTNHAVSARDMFAALRTPRRCIKVGGVIDNIGPNALCNLLFEAFNVQVQGAVKKGSGLYAVLVEDYEAALAVLTPYTNCMWMGPHGAFLATTAEMLSFVRQRVDSMRAFNGAVSFPRHLMTFVPWKPTESKAFISHRMRLLSSLSEESASPQISPHTGDSLGPNSTAISNVATCGDTLHYEDVDTPGRSI